MAQRVSPDRTTCTAVRHHHSRPGPAPHDPDPERHGEPDRDHPPPPNARSSHARSMANVCSLVKRGSNTCLNLPAPRATVAPEREGPHGEHHDEAAPDHRVHPGDRPRPRLSAHCPGDRRGRRPDVQLERPRPAGQPGAAGTPAPGCVEAAGDGAPGAEAGPTQRRHRPADRADQRRGSRPGGSEHRGLPRRPRRVRRRGGPLRPPGRRGLHGGGRHPGRRRGRGAPAVHRG